MAKYSKCRKINFKIVGRMWVQLKGKFLKKPLKACAGENDVEFQ